MGEYVLIIMVTAAGQSTAVHHVYFSDYWSCIGGRADVGLMQRGAQVIQAQCIPTMPAPQWWEFWRPARPN